MSALFKRFVGHPMKLLAIAATFAVAGWRRGRSPNGAVRRPGALLGVAAVWALLAGWEAVVVRFSPEANIRFDLLLLWPAALLVTVALSIRALRGSLGFRSGGERG